MIRRHSLSRRHFSKKTCMPPFPGLASLGQPPESNKGHVTINANTYLLKVCLSRTSSSQDMAASQRKTKSAFDNLLQIRTYIGKRHGFPATGHRAGGWSLPLLPMARNWSPCRLISESHSRRMSNVAAPARHERKTSDPWRHC
nr:hypothetical protein CFP56_38864 [Quercus suber]